MMALPEHGTAPIRCAKRSCSWRGYETELAKVPHPDFQGTCSVCPQCGYESYMFMTKGEIAAWERKKAAQLNKDNQS